MITHVPPALKLRIAQEFGLDAARIFYFPATSAPGEIAKRINEFKTPVLSFWRNEVRGATERMNRPRQRSDEGMILGDLFERDDRFPPEFLMANVAPVDLSFDLNYYCSTTPEVDAAIRAWFLWQNPKRGTDPDIQLKLGVEGLRVPIIYKNQIHFEDPVDASEFDFDNQGVLYHWVFPLVVKSWVVRFDKLPSILVVKAQFYDGLDEDDATLLSTRLVPEPGSE